MAEKQFKKLQIGPAVSYVDADLGIKIDDKEVGGGSGKVWKTIKLTEEIIDSLSNTGTADFRLEAPYDPSNYENDYVKAIQDIEGERIGNLVSEIEPLHRLYVDFVHVNDWCNASVQADFINASDAYGFIHQNYRMGIIYAKSDNVDFVAINTNKLDTIKEDYSDAQIAGGVTTLSGTSAWTASTECPFENEFAPGEIKVGYKEDGTTYIICYHSYADDKYYYTAQTTGASTVYLRGSNVWWDGGLTTEAHPDFVLETEIANEPVMVNTNPMNAYNIVYIADVSRQSWDTIESNPGVEPGQGGHDYDTVGKQYAISIHGKNTKVSYLMVFEEGEMSVINSESHEIASWNPVEAGSVYHLTWDATANRFSLGTELTAAEKEALYSTGIEFDSNGGAMEVKMITDDEHETVLWTATVVGSSSQALKYVFSADEEFREPEETNKAEYIARPLGFEVDTYTSFDSETRTYVTHKEGEYVWECEVPNVGTLKIYVPLPTREGEEMDTCSLRVESSHSVAYNYLYRHNFRIAGTTSAGKTVAVTMSAVNCQQANASVGYDVLNYMINSDTNTGWTLSANGIFIDSGTRYDVISLTNISGGETPTIGGNILYAECVDNTGATSIKALVTLEDVSTVACSDDCIYIGTVIA